MATIDEMRGAAARRVRILDRIRTGLENDWAAPTVLELAEAEHVTRRAIDTDLTTLEREGLIVQDTTTRPRRIILTGHTLRVIPDPVDAEIMCGATLRLDNGRTVDCDLPDGHPGEHRHVYRENPNPTTTEETDQP